MCHLFCVLFFSHTCWRRRTQRNSKRGLGLATPGRGPEQHHQKQKPNSSFTPSKGATFTHATTRQNADTHTQTRTHARTRRPRHVLTKALLFLLCPAAAHFPHTFCFGLYFFFFGVQCVERTPAREK